jgi:hypothetical protein
VWLIEIQTQRSTSCLSSAILALLKAHHCFLIEHPQKQTHHHRIVDRLKRPPKILQTHPPLPRAIFLGTLALTTGSFKTKLAGT